MYKRKITIDHEQVLATNLENFPVLISLKDNAFRSTTNGGRIVDPHGKDIFFTLSDGQSRLAHQITVYSPETGQLEVWVKVPSISCKSDTVLYLYYGDSHLCQPPDNENVWDSSYKTVLHLNGNGNADVMVPHSESLNIIEKITVEAWVKSVDPSAEVLQAIVSKWSPLRSFDSFEAYDASKTDDLENTGYFGAVFDGRYIYFVPQRHKVLNSYERYAQHGVVLRYDTQGSFKDPNSFNSYDAGNTSCLNTKGFYGSVFDGRYVYFVPRQDSEEHHSRVLRYDTHIGFKDPVAWDAFDVGEAHSQQGAAFDGRYIYFCPGYAGDPYKGDTLSSRVIRYDTKSDFKEKFSWRSVDVSDFCGSKSACFDGGAFDGRYIYFVPLLNHTVVRYDTKGDFESPRNWQAYDAEALKMKKCVGVVFDGRFMYFVPYANSMVVRYDTRGEFTDHSGWASYEAGGTMGLNTGGFDGGFFDGRYVYFLPFVSELNDGNVYHCNFLRYNTQGMFDDPKSWQAFDAGATSGMETVGYNAGAFDGRYFYLAPWGNRPKNTGIHGRILRYDTIGKNGSFSLRYCDYGHNGGLCAAVPGPTFIVNTEKGPISIAANNSLLPGWHHIAGVYDGKVIKLFVDGVLVGERAGSGAIQTNDMDVIIGKIQDGLGHFHGIVGEVRILDIDRKDEWIKTEYRNLISPSCFCCVGEEETELTSGQKCRNR